MKGSSVVCDTSVLVAALRPDSDRHEDCRAQLPRLSALLAHTLLETFRVMTSVTSPPPIPPKLASQMLRALDLPQLQLPPGEYLPLLEKFAAAGRFGGGIYDAQIAATAKHHGMLLLTRDRRAAGTYDVIGVDYELI